MASPNPNQAPNVSPMGETDWQRADRLYAGLRGIFGMNQPLSPVLDNTITGAQPQNAMIGNSNGQYAIQGQNVGVASSQQVTQTSSLLLYAAIAGVAYFLLKD